MKRILAALVLSLILICSFPVDPSEACSDVQNTYQMDEADIHFSDLSYVVVYYDANGGTCSKAFDTVKVGDTLTLPDAERSGYKLKSWVNASGALLMDSSGIPYYSHAGDTVSPTENVYLVALWEEKSVVDSAADFVGSINIWVIVAVLLGIVVLAAVAIKFGKK